MKRTPWKRQDAPGKAAAPRKVSLPKLGKKGQAWAAERARLKVRFGRAGITTCEARLDGCWKDNGLGFAHAKKRRNLGLGELSAVALLCHICHDALEILPEAEMCSRVHAIIDARPVAV